MNTKVHPRTLGRRRAIAPTLLVTTALALLVFGSGCMSITHTAGAGATGGEEASATQWWVFWGMLPLGSWPDSRTLVGDQVNYTVVTRYNTWDVVINLFTGWVGFLRSSMEVSF